MNPTLKPQKAVVTKWALYYVHNFGFVFENPSM